MYKAMNVHHRNNTSTRLSRKLQLCVRAFRYIWEAFRFRPERKALLGFHSNEEDMIQFFTVALHCIKAIQKERDSIALGRLYRELDDHTAHF